MWNFSNEATSISTQIALRDGTLYCANSPNISTKSRDEINYHIAKKHSAAGPKNDHT